MQRAQHPLVTVAAAALISDVFVVAASAFNAIGRSSASPNLYKKLKDKPKLAMSLYIFFHSSKLSAVIIPAGLRIASGTNTRLSINSNRHRKNTDNCSPLKRVHKARALFLPGHLR